MLNPYGSNKFRVTSPQGMRNGSMHNGIDLVCDGNKTIYAVCDGTVAQSRIVTDKTNLTWQWGNYVALQDSSGKLLYHCHMSQRIAQTGQKVKKGDILGIEGSTGYSTGSHMHFEVRSGSQILDAAAYLGIPNAAGTYGGSETPVNYRQGVIQKTGISDITADYIEAYQYSADLWMKLWKAMYQ